MTNPTELNAAVFVPFDKDATGEVFVLKEQPSRDNLTFELTYFSGAIDAMEIANRRWAGVKRIAQKSKNADSNSVILDVDETQLQLVSIHLLQLFGHWIML